MGLFGKMFEKKTCAFCGGDIGLFGNRKLEDGNMCKDCAALLSPWFSDRKNSTVAEIQEQLTYREENRAKLETFHTTRSLGRNNKVLIDEEQSLFMVSRTKNIKDENPDILAFSQVTGCDLDIEEENTVPRRPGMEIINEASNTDRAGTGPGRPGDPEPLPGGQGQPGAAGH